MGSPSGFAEATDQAASIPAVLVSLVAAGAAYLFAHRWWAGAGDAFRVVPAFYVIVVLGAMLCVTLLTARARLIGDARAAWMATGLAIAGLFALGQATVIMRFSVAPIEFSSDAIAGMYLSWHAALAVFAVGAIRSSGATRLRWGLAAFFLVVALATTADVRWDFLPRLVDGQERFTPLYSWLHVLVAVATIVAVGMWWVSCGRRPTRPDTWIGVGLMLAAFDLLAAGGAERLFESIWWSSAALRAAQFGVPAVGLLADALRLMGRLHLHERSLTELLQTERDAALRQAEPGPREPIEYRRIRTVIDERRFTIAFQPIYSLRTGQLSALEALARFTAEPRRPPNLWFDAADRCGLGATLELATLATALRAAADRPSGVALTVNLSPTALTDPQLAAVLVEHGTEGLIVEITEHAAVHDYTRLTTALDALRERGILIAVDDAGAGFSSLHHIVQLRPDIIKLDMSLTRAIHADPVRRALAGSIADFAQQMGIELIAEGVETVEELETLAAIGVHAAQGYLLARPGPLSAAHDRLASDLIAQRVR